MKLSQHRCSYGAMVVLLLILFTSGAISQSWPPPPPGNQHWSGIFGSNQGPIPFGAKVSAMFPNGDVVIAGRVGTGVKVTKWETANQRWVDLGERLRREGQTFSDVFDIEVLSNGDVYISGLFDRADNGSGLPTVRCNGIFHWNAGATPPQWEPVGAGLDNGGFLAVDEANGLVYVTNALIARNTDSTIVPVNRLGRWNIANSQWEAVGSGVDQFINDVNVAANGDVYICGGFADLLNPNGTLITVNHIARWDGASWSALGQGVTVTSFFPHDLVFDSNGILYVAGFDGVAVNSDGTQVNGPVVRWDGSNWQVVPPPLLSMLTSAEMTADNNGNVYLLYDDTGFTGRHLECYDGAAWQDIADYQGETTFTIASSKQYTGIRLYYGGLYSAIVYPQNGVTYPVINNALYNGNRWFAMRGFGSSNGRILTMHILEPYGDALVVGGEFSQIAGIDAQNVAYYDGNQWAPLGIGVNGSVYTVYHYVHYLVVGGEFSHAINAPGDSLLANNIAVFNLNTGLWEPIGQGVDGPVYALWARMDNLTIGLSGEVLVGGSFTTGFNPDGTPVPLNSFGQFRFDPTGSDLWENPGLTNGVVGGAAEVHTIARLPFAHSFDDFYIGGSFAEGNNTNGINTNSPNILYWDGLPTSGWLPLGQGTDGIVREIEYFLKRGPIGDNAIWIGGEFQNMFDDVGNPIFCRNLGTWYEIVDQWFPVAGGTDGPVYSISTLRAYSSYNFPEYVAAIGGDFSLGYYQNGNARAVNNVALFSIGNTYPGLIPNWNAMGDGINDQVRAMTTFTPCFGAGEHLLVGGDFTAAGNRGARDLAKWKRRFYGPGIAYVASGGSSGGGGSGSRAVMSAPPCFDINKTNSLLVETVWFDSLGFGESVMLDSLPNYRPFDLLLTDAVNLQDTLTVLDSVVIGFGSPLALIITGVDDTSAYAPNPEGLSTALRLMPVPVPATGDNATDVQVVFANAVTDAPAVDIVLQGGNTLTSGLSLGEYSPPVNLSPGNYTVEIRDSVTQQVLNTFVMNLQNSAGKALTRVLQGFVDPAANQNGPPMELGTIDLGSTIITGIKDDAAPPVAKSFELRQNYPNPFNPATNIEFRVNRAVRITLKIFDVLGREVKTLADGIVPPGSHTMQWDGRNNAGQGSASGIYFYRLQVEEDFVQTRKMMFLK